MNIDTLIFPERLGPALVEATGDSHWSEFSAELITGGKSNLTFTLRNAVGKELVLRRPPTGDLLPSAHDMGREVRIQKALATTSIPVPRIVLFDEGDLIGIDFYVMEKIEGHIVRDALPSGFAETVADRTRLAEVFVDTLAALHEVDYAAVGLREFGRPEGFMERQVRRWAGQWEASKTHSVSAIEELGERLAAGVPAQPRTGIVHGDYRIDNVVYNLSDPSRIDAVLDWELSTIGDSLADLGNLMLYWRAPGERQLSLIPGITHLDGFPDREEMLQRYEERSGIEVSEIGFYQAFAHYKFAIITQGVSARSKAGAMGGQDFGDLDDDVQYLGESGLAYLKGS